MSGEASSRVCDLSLGILLAMCLAFVVEYCVSRVSPVRIMATNM